MKRVLRVGTLVGVGMIYVSVIGLLDTFNSRLVIDPWLSLGYLMLFAAPLIGGLRFANREKLEGLEPEPPSITDVTQAVVAGVIGGLIAALFALLVSSFRDV